MTPQGYYYAANNFATSEHGGTHLDAPVHFAKDHWAVDQIPLDRLVGDAVVVDVTAPSSSQPDYRVDHRRLHGLGADQRRDSRRRDRADPDRLLEVLAGCGALSRHRGAR